MIRSLLDTDLYKLLMARWALQQHPDVEVRFALLNRSPRIRLAEQLDLEELRLELQGIQALRFSPADLAALAALRIGGQEVFPAAVLGQLSALRLPPFELQVDQGQLQLQFCGRWPEVMLWEVPALAVIMELRARTVLRRLSDTERQRVLQGARDRLEGKLARLARLPGLQLVDFGTRRRFSAAWQEQVLLTARERLGPALLGTSNVELALRHGLPPIGTNAHELPMVLAALADSDAELAAAPYRVLEDWQQVFSAPLDVVLPDAYGTEGFLARAPAWVARWHGMRLDSGDPLAMGERLIAWWVAHGEDPRDKTVIFSDGLDVDAIEQLHEELAGQVRLCFGWGTLLSNDFRGLGPDDALAPLSLVCKAISANGRPTVKLSDTAGKTLGPAGEVSRYRRVFAASMAAERELEV
ncbi:MAG: nicotinate phosphoribosyltransferase [Synechococcaceae cyanobacterium]|nr:nicotinate phosphoribosyltransferase [Synechococcaceae cyanobacterium]